MLSILYKFLKKLIINFSLLLYVSKMSITIIFNDIKYNDNRNICYKENT